MPFIGWIALERKANRRRIVSTSLPKYLSFVRQMQLLLTGRAVPEIPLVTHILRAFKTWEEDQFPQARVRCGIPSTIMQRIWGLGIESDDIRVVRDCTACVFAFCFNGLLESSVMSILFEDVVVAADEILARLSVVKGRSASRQFLVVYHRLATISSPFDLFRKWVEIYGTHSLLFSIVGEPTEWVRGSLDQALRRVLQLLHVCPPDQGSYSSHSIRIGTHTEQTLLGIPLEVRLARFGWGAGSH